MERNDDPRKINGLRIPARSMNGSQNSLFNCHNDGLHGYPR